jgi:hypothetical protein
MIIKTSIARHPALTYYALVFPISWGGILTGVGPAGILGAKYHPRALTQFVYVAHRARCCRSRGSSAGKDTQAYCRGRAHNVRQRTDEIQNCAQYPR